MGEFYGNQHRSSNRDTYEELVAKVEDLAEELGHPPTTEEATADDRFPSIATLYRILDDDWAQLLRDAGIEPTSRQVGEYDSEDMRKMLVDIRATAADSPGTPLTTREYDERGDFTTSTIKQLFGSWSDACLEANVVPGSKYGVNCTGPNGNMLESFHELQAAKVLDRNDVEYEVHPSVPKSDWVADFYIPVADLWIEIDGFPAGKRPNAESFANKVKHYEVNDLPHLVIGYDQSIPTLLQEHIDRV